MISQTSTKKKESARFIEFLHSPEVQRLLFEKGGYVPVNTEVYSDSTFLVTHPELTFYHRLMKRGFHRPSLVDYTRASDVVSHFVRTAILDQVSAVEALRKAGDMITSKAVLIR